MFQYIAETKRRLEDRFNEHRQPIINTCGSYIPTVVSRHFLTGNHTENHMILVPLERLYTSRDSIRKAREAFLIHRGNTLEPAGLNRRDEKDFVTKIFIQINLKKAGVGQPKYCIYASARCLTNLCSTFQLRDSKDSAECNWTQF